MKSIGHLLLMTLVSAAPTLVALPAAAGGGTSSPTTQTGQGISGLLLSLSKALAQGMVVKGPVAVDIASDACGELAVTTASTCEVTVDAACLAGCDPSNFTVSAFIECATSCNVPAADACKLSCNPTCKSSCMSEDNFNAVATCASGCQASCGAKCAQLSAAGQVDQVECEIACDTSCSSECSAAASVAQIDNCGVQCGVCCQAQCEAEINMGCQIACQTELFAIETESCVASCDASASLLCDGAHVEVDNIQACVDALVAAGVPVTEE